jgi:hypothetical protein
MNSSELDSFLRAFKLHSNPGFTPQTLSFEPKVITPDISSLNREARPEPVQQRTFPLAAESNDSVWAVRIALTTPMSQDLTDIHQQFARASASHDQEQGKNLGDLVPESFF